VPVVPRSSVPHLRGFGAVHYATTSGEVTHILRSCRLRLTRSRGIPTPKSRVNPKTSCEESCVSRADRRSLRPGDLLDLTVEIVVIHRDLDELGMLHQQINHAKYVVISQHIFHDLLRPR
jgi:hypothetical protein